MSSVLALVTALAVAIPTVWAIWQHIERRRVEKDLAKAKSAIRKAVTERDADKVRRELARWL